MKTLERAVPPEADGAGADPRHERFEREAALDRWVQAHGDAMRERYERHATGRELLVFATSRWTREKLEGPEVEHGVAAIAAGVAASARCNLEPACSRLLWVTRRDRHDPSALEAAEHYATLAFVTAKRAAERESAECVMQAVRFVRAGRDEDLDVRAAALERVAALAERRLSNFASLVGAHFPFWSFPYAFRWDEPAPRFGRGPLGLADPLDEETLEGIMTLAYRRGRSRAELSEAVERCACAIRRLSPGGLDQARATALVSELARDLRDSWAVRDAASPGDLVERVVPRALSTPFVRGVGDHERGMRRATAALVPVLLAHWPDLIALGTEHRAHRRARDAASGVLAA